MARLRYELLALVELLPIEEVDEAAVAVLAEAISYASIWTSPLCIERFTAIVMDGNHRLAAAKRLGLACVPCVRYGYDEVAVSATRDDIDVDGDSIIAKALSGALYPAKTTKHIFPEYLTVRVPLARLIGMRKEKMLSLQ